MFLKPLPSLRVLNADNRTLTIGQQLISSGFCYDTGFIRVDFGDLLEHLNQSIRDRHARETLFAWGEYVYDS
jgi:hypothetical protein